MCSFAEKDLSLVLRLSEAGKTCACFSNSNPDSYTHSFDSCAQLCYSPVPQCIGCCYPATHGVHDSDMHHCAHSGQLGEKGDFSQD